jgi:hypothetical protein
MPFSASILEVVLAVGSFAASAVASVVACHQAVTHPLPAAAFAAGAAAYLRRQQLQEQQQEQEHDWVESGIPPSLLHPLATVVAMVAGWVVCLTAVPVLVRLVAISFKAMVSALRFSFVTLPAAIVSGAVQATPSVVHLPKAFVTSFLKASQLAFVAIPSKAIQAPIKVLAYVVMVGIVPVIVAVLKSAMVAVVTAAKFAAVSSLSFAVAVIPDLAKLVGVSIPCVLFKVLVKVATTLAKVVVTVIRCALRLALITVPVAVAAAAVRVWTSPAVVAIPPLAFKGIVAMVRLLCHAALFCCVTVPGGFFAIVASEMAAAAAAAQPSPSVGNSNQQQRPQQQQQRPQQGQVGREQGHRGAGTSAHVGSTGGRVMPPPPPTSSGYAPPNHQRELGITNGHTGGRNKPPPPPPPPPRAPTSSGYAHQREPAMPNRHVHNGAGRTVMGATGGRVTPPLAPTSAGYNPPNHHRELDSSNRRATGGSVYNGIGTTSVGGTGGRITPPPPPASSNVVRLNHHREQEFTSSRRAAGPETVQHPDVATSNGYPGRGPQHGAGTAMRVSGGRTMPVQETRSACFHSSRNTNQARNTAVHTVNVSSHAPPPIPDRPCSNHRISAALSAPRQEDQHGRRAAVVATAPSRASVAAAVVPERPVSHPSVRAAPVAHQPGVQQRSSGSVRAVAPAGAANVDAAPRRPKMKSQKVRTAEAKRSLNLQAEFFQSLAGRALNAARSAGAAVFPRGTFTPFRGEIQTKRRSAAARLAAARQALDTQEAYLHVQARACVRRY